jgi:hypothetical protein
VHSCTSSPNPRRKPRRPLERTTNESIVDKTKGEFESTFAFKFQGVNGTTKVFFDEEYTIPVLEKEYEPYFAWWNEYEADTIVQSLKAWFERT